LVNVFRPAEARRLAEFKASAQPAGLIDVTMTMGAGQGADPAPLRIEITNLVEPQMNFLGGRLSARNLGGRLILDQADPGVITLDSIEGAFNFDGQPLGRLTVSGGRALEAGRHAPLRVDFDDARIESPLLAQQIERVGGEVAGWQWRQAAPAGLASGWLTFDTTVTEDGPQATVSALRIEPHMLSWMRNGARAQPQRISGVIVGDTTSGALAGTVDQLEFSADRYSARASGPWTITEGRGLGATLALDAHLDPPPPHESHESLESREFHEDAPGDFEPPANIIPPDVRALLPAPARAAIEAATLPAGGRPTLASASWRFRAGAAADGAGSAENAPAFEGRVQLETAAGGLDQQIQVAGVQAWVTVQPA